MNQRVMIGVVVEATLAANSYCGILGTKLAKKSRPQLESETTQSSPIELTAQSLPWPSRVRARHRRST